MVGALGVDSPEQNRVVCFVCVTIVQLLVFENAGGDKIKIDQRMPLRLEAVVPRNLPRQGLTCGVCRGNLVEMRSLCIKKRALCMENRLG